MVEINQTSEEHGEYGPYNLTVLIARLSTTNTKVRVYNRGQKPVKFVQNEKYSAKSGDYLSFFAYLCHVIDEFQLL